MGAKEEPMDHQVKPLPATAPLGSLLADEAVVPASQLYCVDSPSLITRSLSSPAVLSMAAVASVREYCLEEVGGHLTRLEYVYSQDACLPITESRKGNAFHAAVHTLCSGIGFQALLLPVAFASLGWAWGIISLSLAFIWQLYTIWLLTQLHESSTGIRYSRYLQLCMVAFGDKLGRCLAKFPIMYLSAGTCTTLIFVGGGSMRLFFETVCGTTCIYSKPLTTIEWYLVFICLAVVLAQLPNLNSIAIVSFIGSITAISYCTIIWLMSVAKGRANDISYEPVETKSEVRRVLAILNGLGIIAFVFRGHNLVLEIQVPYLAASSPYRYKTFYRLRAGASAVLASPGFSRRKTRRTTPRRRRAPPAKQQGRRPADAPTCRR